MLLELGHRSGRELGPDSHLARVTAGEARNYMQMAGAERRDHKSALSSAS